ncbi:MAG TPA: RND transporter, partial [Acidimicrobiia bacterium]
MRRFWDWLGLNLGRHWILVMLVGAVATVGLGFGATRLAFSTGQENYLNKSDQVYKDNVAYQKLFGGQAMVALVTMAPGHKVAELFTPANVAQWQAVEREIRGSHKVLDVVSPLTALQWNDGLVRSPSGDPTASVAGKIIAGELQRDPSAAGKQVRLTDATKTLQRLSAIPLSKRSIDDPAYLDVLL